MAGKRAGASVPAHLARTAPRRGPPYLTWGPQRDQKESLVKKSKQRWRYRVGVAVLAVIIALGVFAWWLSPWGQIGQVKRDLMALTAKIQDEETLWSAATAFARVGSFTKALDAARAISSPYSRAMAFGSIVAAAQAGDQAQTQALIAEVLEITRAISNSSSKLRVLRSIAEAAAKSGHWRLARDAASQNVTDAGEAYALAAILEVWAARNNPPEEEARRKRTADAKSV